MDIRRQAGRYQLEVTLIAVAMVFTMLLSLNGFWRAEVPATALFLYSLVAVAFAWLTWRNIWGALLLLVMTAGGIALGIYRLPTWADYFSTLGYEAVTLIQELSRQQFDATFGPVLGGPVLLATGSAVALVIIHEALRAGRAFWSILLGLCVFGIQWSWFWEKSANYSAIYGVLAFALWIVGQAAVRNAEWQVAGRKVNYPSIVWAPLIWVLAAALIAGILPDNFNAANLGTWAAKLQESFPALSQMRGGGIAVGSRFSLASTGFAPMLDTLGGPARVDNRTALTVALEYPIQETLYLRGATFQTYTGEGWLRGEPAMVNVPKDGNLLTGFTSDVMFGSATVQITHEQALGYTLFNLLEPVRADGARGTFKADADANTWVDRVVRRGTPYTVTSRIPRYSAEQIRLLGTGAPSEAMAPYLAVPAIVPPSVQELTAQITGEAKHPFDKAVAIENYLRSLTYDLDAPAAPKGRDFVAFFLTDLKRGYCVYSASAMAVMLREVGIPSRLVEGFGVPSSTPHDRDSENRYVYKVSNAQAHAWVEAFFPGYGWVAFDPTPRQDFPVIDRSTPLPTSNPTPEAESGEVDRQSHSRNNTPEDDKMSAEDGPGYGPGAAESPYRNWPWYSLGVGLLSLLILLAYRRLEGQERVQSADGRTAVQELWLKTGWILGLFGSSPKPHQTPQEYAADVGQSWPSLKEQVTEVAADYTEARYGPPERTPAPEAAGRARGLWRQANDLLAVTFGWREYLWRRLRGRGKATGRSKK